ncbi:MAG: hypothetical protein GY770_35820 [Aestuariibacter sp.]|nr:hypothetical protein [Aestuariibacter sp.]
MNTQSHVLIASALFSKSGTSSTARNISAVSGGLLPDLAIFIMFFWSKVTGTPEHTVWNEWYFNSKWQFVIDISNSLPLFITLLLIGSAIAKWYKKKAKYGLLLIIFSLAAITHLAGDFFLHVDDAHAHFQPLSDWRFSSPFSYWNPNHYGRTISMIEAMLGISLSILLFRRFGGMAIRALLILAVAAYVVTRDFLPRV